MSNKNHISPNELHLMDAVSDMFLAFPAASKTSADQIRVYVQELSGWPASVVARAIKAARADPGRNKDFPPSVDVIKDKLRTTGMTAPERVLLESLNASTEPKRISA